MSLLGFPSATVTLIIGTPMETPAALSVACIAGAGLLALEGANDWRVVTDKAAPRVDWLPRG